MGFSVSASVAILAAALLIGFGMFHSAAYDTVERVTDARSDARDDLLDQQNTAINVTGAVLYSSNDTTRVTVVNDGATTLNVDETDLLINNEYRTDFDSEVEGDNTTDLWQSGEELTFSGETPALDPANETVRVKVVSGPGVAATAEVTESG
ncbi:flagellin [Halorhabdus rudnickae]|uniref:flagellin n=1 Tax=Halorhabdus rudnickae TaxID=1775544 RepID=UPI001083C115|nr:flagellin [Halorhabdus rudnickae]